MKDINVYQLIKKILNDRPSEVIWQSSSNTVQLPPQFTRIILLICILPFLLNLFGIDFASREHVLELEAAVNMSSHSLNDTLHYQLTGSFTHTILEWTAFCTAIFTTVLAFAHFSIQRDVTTPVIGVALLCAGIMDAFHTLAANRLIEAVADNRNLIPFTWAICRMFNALLTMIGVSIFLGRQSQTGRGNIAIVTSTSLIFGLIAYNIIKLCATSQLLPETMFPDALITRPWDVAPLAIFIFSGLLIYPKFHKKYPSVFAHSLIISTIPNAVTQLHMAFGSTALFDRHFNIAHFLKIIAYLVPLTGLIFDYITTHRQLQKANLNFLNEIDRRKLVEQQLRESKKNLKTKKAEFSQALFELKATQVELIQQEKMASLGNLVGGMAHEINNPISFIHGNINHVKDYIEELLTIVELYDREYPTKTKNIQELIEDIDIEFIKEDLPRLLNSMQNGTHRIRELIICLRNFSRLDEADLKQVDLHEGLDNTLLILKHRLDSKIAIVKDYHSLPLIECYPAQINQVWMNIVSNAIDALNSDINLTEKNINISTTVNGSNLVTVKIYNNGPEIPETIKDKIFDPFFTTKPVGSGTGLGLAIAYQIIKQHNGQISCESNSDRGTKFTITLPTAFS